jgi:asparagine synthase (glutamine-hydrolysing)
MCGIAGILCPPSAGGLEARDLDPELRRLAVALRHRGPDSEGIHIARGSGLAHTRLAILDLSPTGAQPMLSPDGNYAIAFNGEVYNFAALRDELEAAGERFVGRSDTEVVLRLLLREGPAALSRFDGMFALALLDRRSGEVLLARDRTGQKPLYVAPLAGQGWAFASEVEPLLSVPGVDASIDPRSLSHLLTFGFLPAPFSLRRGLAQLRPGHFGWLRAGQGFEPKRYVEELGPRVPLLAGSESELSYELERVLSTSVARHLVADVPVGVLLSGGVDSSTVAALAARHTGRLKTFAVIHGDPRYDERDASRAVAQAIDSDHHEVEFSEQPLSEEELDTLVGRHGDPFADSSSLAVLLLSREMRRHVTVALSGDGGDEIFAGYPRYAMLEWIGRVRRLPAPARALASGLLGALPGTLPRQVARALHVAAMPRGRRMIALKTLFWPSEQRRLLRPEWCFADAESDLDELVERLGARLEPSEVASAHWLEQRLILPDQMLTKVDRMSMSTSLEVRPPLLGNEVLEFAARLPFSLKRSRGSGKRVLKALARRLVPAWVVDRRKVGFAVPLKQHGGPVLAEATRFALESRESPLRALFREEALAELTRSLAAVGEGRHPEDSPYRRVHRQWLLALLARSLANQGIQ